MSTQQTAPTLFFDAGSQKYAYRRFGTSTNSTTPPLLFIVHFRATQDDWDPALLNPLSKTREVITFDLPGVGHTPGEVLDSITAMAASTAQFIRALSLPTAVDVCGFSMGGLITQRLTVDYPDLVRKALLLGTTIGGGPGTEDGPAELFGLLAIDDSFEAYKKTFFHASETSEKAGRAWWSRIQERKDKAPWVQSDGIGKQGGAIGKFRSEGGDGVYNELEEIPNKVLVIAGRNDQLTPAVNSFMLHRRIPNSRLVSFPDSSHGVAFQFVEESVKIIEDFLEKA